MLKVKRVYEKYNENDGCRVLVDRLWPRGLSKEEAHIDLWVKDIAPTTELRAWFGHDLNKWDEFKKRYYHELEENKAAVFLVMEQINKSDVTLVYGAKDEEHNNAIVLRDYLEKK
jgi:uncharacterized protein YeaO (DUF488 family)